MAQTHVALWINYHENEHESFLVRSAYIKTIILKQLRNGEVDEKKVNLGSMTGEDLSQAYI